jgi:hypothetical protein
MPYAHALSTAVVATSPNFGPDVALQGWGDDHAPRNLLRQRNKPVDRVEGGERKKGKKKTMEAKLRNRRHKTDPDKTGMKK